MKWEKVPCGLCSSEDSRIIFYSPISENSFNTSDFLATTDQYGAYGTVVQCRQCGLIYTNPRPQPDQILTEYRQSHDPDYLAETESRSINAFLSLATIRQFVPHGRLLDLGCSTGFFLNAARTYFEVEGVEPSQWARDFALKQLNLTIRWATLEEAKFPAASFDVVTMLDVIEHLPDPLQTLSQVARILKPQGFVYIVTPDISGLAAKILRGYWWGLRPSHLYYFTPESLGKMLHRDGLEVAARKSFGRIFTYGYWLSRLKNYPRPLYRMVASIAKSMRLESNFLYINTRDSMEICARKSG